MPEDIYFALSYLTGGMRTPDRGSTTGAASWIDDEPARRLPTGRAQRVNPPHRHLKERVRTKVRAFFRIKSPVHCRMAAQFTGALSGLHKRSATGQ
ncbi:hypothetical protein AC369_18155 [Salmonella enterica subsp. diarizonae]|nr:hypothetical protein [Salmonella enterica subsp. diarizonae]ECI5662465.1 hypothetical protein [Salmonella enterica subsp. diarizonae]MJK42485.1 hypothetical protein [Salmonella enterica subsp. diarizonae]